MIDIQEMYKYSLVLPLDSLKDLEEILTLTKLRCLNILSNIPQCSRQCQHHHSQHVGAGATITICLYF